MKSTPSASPRQDAHPQRGKARRFTVVCPECGDPGNVFALVGNPSRLRCMACSKNITEAKLARIVAEWTAALAWLRSAGR